VSSHPSRNVCIGRHRASSVRVSAWLRRDAPYAAPPAVPRRQLLGCVDGCRQMSTRSTDGSVIRASRSVVVVNPNWSLIFASFCGLRPKTSTSSISDRSAYGGVGLAKTSTK
jgi:hypothetical protein